MTQHSVRAAAAAGVLAMWLSGGPAAAQVATTTATFQNGTDGYTGTFDRRIGNNEVNGADVDTDLSAFFVDGGGSALNDAGVQQVLIRFDSLTAPGAIPANAVVVNATLEMQTTGFSNSQSGGAYNVYQLSRPFDGSSTYAGFGGDGIAGDVSAIGGSFDRPVVSAPITARVDNVVQNWVSGGANNGFGIRSDRTTDGWAFNTTGASTVVNRPKLNVTYTTTPGARVVAVQQGVNGYAGTVDNFPNGTSGATVGTSTNGATVSEAFLDGSNGTDSFDQPYMLRFDNLDLNFDSIAKAELVVKTGFSSSAADTSGPFNVHRLLRPFTAETTYASLDSDGNPGTNDYNELLANGYIAPASAFVLDANDTEVIHVDVTSIVDAWRNGAPNHGFYFGADTSNGWQIFASGAIDPALAPELRIVGVSVVPEPAGVGLLGLTAAAALARRRRPQA